MKTGRIFYCLSAVAVIQWVEGKKSVYFNIIWEINKYILDVLGPREKIK